MIYSKNKTFIVFCLTTVIIFMLFIGILFVLKAKTPDNQTSVINENITLLEQDFHNIFSFEDYKIVPKNDEIEVRFKNSSGSATCFFDRDYTLLRYNFNVFHLKDSEYFISLLFAGLFGSALLSAFIIIVSIFIEAHITVYTRKKYQRH